MLTYGIENRYASKIKAKLNGDCLICGKGGETSTGLLNKFDVDFMPFKPKYTLLAIGTNDSDFNLWLSNIKILIDKVQLRGSIPILVTLTCRQDLDRSAMIASVNNWIMSSGYKYVDANLVTSLNNDRVTFDSSMFLADKIHPNVAGHDAIYKRFLVDVPEVFDFE